MKKLYFLGPIGSYSHIISRKVFPGRESVSCHTFTDIVNNVLSQKTSIGVLPIENSITSDIHENMDFLFNKNLKIIAEGFLKINLHLVGLKETKLSDIKTIYSHDKALEQCQKFISGHRLFTTGAGSTAEAASIIVKLNEKKNAAITARTVINHQSLIVLKENIGDIKHNMSRFVFITHAKSKFDAAVKNKISVICTIAHRPGTLARLLNSFAQLGVNLTKIESRPIPGTDWEYQFWIDIELDTTIYSLAHVLTTLKSATLQHTIKGIYEIGKQYES